MFINKTTNNLGTNALEGDEGILGIYNIDGYTVEQMEMIWLISSKCIDSMYRKNIKEKKGEG